MNRKEIVLASLAPAAGSQHSPVQVQKMFFLIDRNIAEFVGGPHFDFQPYHYGPFDKTVYTTLKDLEKADFVDLVAARNWHNYRLTVSGQKQGDKILTDRPVEVRRYIARVSAFVRGLSFTQLVAAIYKAYPEMRVNGVFQRGAE